MYLRQKVTKVPASVYEHIARLGLFTGESFKQIPTALFEVEGVPGRTVSNCVVVHAWWVTSPRKPTIAFV